LPPDSGWELYDAKSINDEGRLVGHGSHDGTFAAFLMTLPR
jgi:hypothetical protein